MKHLAHWLKVFFISLYNFLVGLPEIYDVEIKDFYDEKLGEHCNEYGTLAIRPFQKAVYDFVIRSSDGKRERYDSILLKVRLFDGILTLTHDKTPILHGKAVKADDGSFILEGPGFVRNKRLTTGEKLAFERLWDIPFEV